MDLTISSIVSAVLPPLGSGHSAQKRRESAGFPSSPKLTFLAIENPPPNSHLRQMNFHGVNRARNTLSVGACRSRSVLVYSATFLSAPRMCQRDAKHIPFLVLNRSRILYQPAVRLKSLCKSRHYESRIWYKFST